MSPPNFPIGPDGLRGRWSFANLTPGDHRIEGFDVEVAEVPHKGGRTFGFRIRDGTGWMAYVPDHLPAPEPEPSPALAALLASTDLLVHDAQFLAPERAVADLYGHATVDDAIRIATSAGVRTLALFHHSPGRAGSTTTSTPSAGPPRTAASTWSWPARAWS